jgi:hypothetical protein
MVNHALQRIKAYGLESGIEIEAVATQSYLLNRTAGVTKPS